MIAELAKACVKGNASTAQSQEEYAKKYNGLLARYEIAVAKYNKLDAEIAKRRGKAQEIARFIDQLRSAPLVLDEWDNKVWSQMVEKATVNRDKSILFRFRNWKQIKVEAK